MPLSMYLQALQIDLLRVLIWQNTEDGQKNRNRPESLAEKFRDETENKETETFDGFEDFEAYRAAIFAKSTQTGGE